MTTPIFDSSNSIYHKNHNEYSLNSSLQLVHDSEQARHQELVASSHATIISYHSAAVETSYSTHDQASLLSLSTVSKSCALARRNPRPSTIDLSSDDFTFSTKASSKFTTEGKPPILTFCSLRNPPSGTTTTTTTTSYRTCHSNVSDNNNNNNNNNILPAIHNNSNNDTDDDDNAIIMISSTARYPPGISSNSTPPQQQQEQQQEEPPDISNMEKQTIPFQSNNDSWNPWENTLPFENIFASPNTTMTSVTSTGMIVGSGASGGGDDDDDIKVDISIPLPSSLINMEEIQNGRPIDEEREGSGLTAGDPNNVVVIVNNKTNSKRNNKATPPISLRVITTIDDDDRENSNNNLVVHQHHHLGDGNVANSSVSPVSVSGKEFQVPVSPTNRNNCGGNHFGNDDGDGGSNRHHRFDLSRSTAGGAFTGYVVDFVEYSKEKEGDNDGDDEVTSITSNSYSADDDDDDEDEDDDIEDEDDDMEEDDDDDSATSKNCDVSFTLSLPIGDRPHSSDDVSVLTVDSSFGGQRPSLKDNHDDDDDDVHEDAVVRDSDDDMSNVYNMLMEDGPNDGPTKLVSRSQHPVAKDGAVSPTSIASKALEDPKLINFLLSLCP